MDQLMKTLVSYGLIYSPKTVIDHSHRYDLTKASGIVSMSGGTAFPSGDQRGSWLARFFSADVIAN